MKDLHHIKNLVEKKMCEKKLNVWQAINILIDERKIIGEFTTTEISYIAGTTKQNIDQTERIGVGKIRNYFTKITKTREDIKDYLTLATKKERELFDNKVKR